MVRLGHEVEDTGVNGVEHLRHRPFFTQDDHREDRVHRLQTTEDLEAIHVGHIEIGDHEIEIGCPGLLDRLRAVFLRGTQERQPRTCKRHRLGCRQ